MYGNTMDINPMKFQYPATFDHLEGEDAILKIQEGPKHSYARVPRSILPKSYAPGQEFFLKIEAIEAAKQGEFETMKRLLEELIR